MTFVYLYLILIAIMIITSSIASMLYSVAPSLRTNNFGIKAEKYFVYYVLGVIINTPTIILGTYLTF